jgi:hypothetical protein
MSQEMSRLLVGEARGLSVTYRVRVPFMDVVRRRLPFAFQEGGCAAMQFSIGDTVYNITTGERGNIVRLMDKGRYVVSVDLDSRSGTIQREALWLKTQIARSADSIPPMLRRF